MALSQAPAELQDDVHGARVHRTVCLFTPQLVLVPNLYCLVTEATHVNNLLKVALDTESSGIEPAISNRKSKRCYLYATEPHAASTG